MPLKGTKFESQKEDQDFLGDNGFFFFSMKITLICFLTHCDLAEKNNYPKATKMDRTKHFLFYFTHSFLITEGQKSEQKHTHTHTPAHTHKMKMSAAAESSWHQ